MSRSLTLSHFKVFIILKKNNSQLSFLHCYHHTGAVLTFYVAAKWVPGGTGTILPILNGIVHSIMYLQVKFWKNFVKQLFFLSSGTHTISLLHSSPNSSNRFGGKSTLRKFN
jgi:hypothetical protein